MPDLAKKMTNTSAARVPLPAAGYVLHWCPTTPGLGVRVSSTGDRAYIAQRRVDGKTIRRTLGKATGPGAISVDTARRLQVTVSSALQEGADPLAAKRARRAAAKVEGVTLGSALKDYVKTKRRAKDGLPLKERTKADYLAMIEPATERRRAGELHALADKALHRITAEHITQLYRALEPRGERQQSYAMQVLRAVLRHEGISIDNNPLSPTTAGKNKVTIAPSRGNPTPIPAEKLGAWWRAASALRDESADMLKFMLLTGTRPGEAASIHVGDFDLGGKRIVLKDTKNRGDHTLLLSDQAAALAHWHAQGKKPKALLFGVADAGKTLDAINKAAKVEGISPHKLRHTFASIADEILPGSVVKKLLNHASAGDVTLTHYVGKSGIELRAAWQAVADAIEAASVSR